MCGRAEGVDSEAAWCFTRGPANSFCWEGAEVGGHTAGRVNDEREKKNPNGFTRGKKNRKD